jgi:hypothetical protein
MPPPRRCMALSRERVHMAPFDFLLKAMPKLQVPTCRPPCPQSTVRTGNNPSFCRGRTFNDAVREFSSYPPHLHFFSFPHCRAPQQIVVSRSQLTLLIKLLASSLRPTAAPATPSSQRKLALDYSAPVLTPAFRRWISLL